jgi:hypothetical protein
MKIKVAMPKWSVDIIRKRAELGEVDAATQLGRYNVSVRGSNRVAHHVSL